MSTSNSQMQLLISLYEEEKGRLQKMIEECQLENEYLMAHYHFKALIRVNHRLQILNNIEDKHFGAKESLKRRILFCQNQMELERSELMKEYYLKDIQFALAELEKLNEIGKSSTHVNDSLLDDALQKLLNKKISNLKLILKKSDNLYLSFSYTNRIFKLTLPLVKQHSKRNILYNKSINTFKLLGFELSKNETKLTLTIDGSKEIILDRLKLVLSKIVFEVFSFREFGNDSFIQFTEKADAGKK